MTGASGRRARFPAAIPKVAVRVRRSSQCDLEADAVWAAHGWDVLDQAAVDNDVILGRLLGINRARLAGE